MVGVVASNEGVAEVELAHAGAIAKADSQIATERVYIYVFKPFSCLALLLSAVLWSTIWLTTY
ncbi:hypothetical protein B878_15300 [Vibrio campbellii CAIM 519 = NBRC 15631 = ATCC 25920]|nr:hypothetical protein B878_15300 [Vibrio campbellii CAIM 519 = NBRC 15631 = ATCC 25920]